jgi:N-acyl-D-aspartate/D-glutamate deacylase
MIQRRARAGDIAGGGAQGDLFRQHLLKDRGELRAGAFADSVVFNPETIADVATYAEPRQYPAGIEYVVVNGQVAVDQGRQTDARAGRMLRRA